MIIEIDRGELAKAQKEADEGILDGRGIAAALLKQLRPLVRQLELRRLKPCLAVVQVGDDEASEIYIRHKMRACEQVGMRSIHHKLSGETRWSGLSQRLEQLNEDPMVHGVLLQLPLPEGLDEIRAIQSIHPDKDVDGFHPANLGCLMSRAALLEPCTPQGVMTMLAAAGVEPRGKSALVIGRSVIVGRPMASMLTRADATVTLCHRHTKDLSGLVRRADLVVVATGVAELIKGEWIKEGAVVVDVGINRKNGKLTGDVDFDAAREHASLITPVPGGVGPMTVATLLLNTLVATCMQEGLVVRDGQLMDTLQAGVHYHRADQFSVTQLVDGPAPGHRGSMH